MLGGLALTLTLACSTAIGTQAASALSGDGIEQLRAQLRTPGLVIAIAHGDSAPELYAAGVGDTESASRLGGSERFGIGSITKLFVATVVLQLAEEGQLSLEDSLAKYYPAVEGSEHITLRMLLNHSSGLFDYADLRETLPLPLVMIALSKDWDPADVVEIININEPYFAPGTSWRYSNSNYVLLGLIIEQVTGQSAAEALQARLFDPLGMDSAVLTGSDMAAPEGSVHGYELVNGEWHSRALWENPSLAWTAGGIVANAGDLLKFARALFGGELLSTESMAEMQAGVLRPEGGRYGLGLMLEDTGSGPLIGHEGQTLGFRSGLWYLPQNDTAFVVLSNMTNTNLVPVYELLSGEVIKQAPSAAN
jgi:D-alanyl-D-alanine carboxypeptidase